MRCLSVGRFRGYSCQGLLAHGTNNTGYTLPSMNAEYRVFLVLEKECGEHLRELLRTGPVWVVDTPTNRVAAQKIWAERPDGTHLEGVTTFKSSADCAEDALLEQLGTIDLQHGPYSADPPYTVLECIGASATERLKRELGQYGFNEFQPTSTGFRAIRPLAAAVIRR